MLEGGQTDGRTDVTKLAVAFANFANAPKNRGSRQHPSFAELSSCEFFLFPVSQI